LQAVQKKKSSELRETRRGEGSLKNRRNEVKKIHNREKKSDLDERGIRTHTNDRITSQMEREQKKWIGHPDKFSNKRWENGTRTRRRGE